MSKKILVIGFVFPEPKSTAAGRRMLQLLEVFLAMDYQIIFASTAQKTINSFELTTLGIEEKSIKLNDTSFDTFIKEINPNLVLFDRFMTEEQFGWRVAECCPNAIRILDTEDLHCLRKGRELALNECHEFTDKYLINDTAKREIASIYRSDLSLIISEFEVELLKNKFQIPKELIYYLPFLEKFIDIKKSELPDFEERNHFITVGNFLHEPNYQSVLYLKNKIWKTIKKKLPKAEIHIYGAYSSQKVTDLHNEKEGFIVKGFTDDIQKTLSQYKVCLAPLQFGAGLKGKLIDAMKTGTSCVMTSIAAEGMFGDVEPNGYISDNPSIFTEKAVELYSNKLQWEKAQQNGFYIINSRFNREYFELPFSKEIENLAANIIEHRNNNFIGSMLQHHTLQSTKYLSKWIEEKNN